MRWLLAPISAAVFVAGVWLTGGVITDNFGLAMVLTAVWFGAAGLFALAMLRARGPGAYPVAAGLAAAAIVVGGYLGLATLRDKVVDEEVAMAGTGGNVAVAAGSFRSVEHSGEGRAAVVRRGGGGHVLTLTDFETDAGPDLRVRLVRGDTTDGGAAGAIDLGGLKGNRGNQQYDLPRGNDGKGYSVVVWCRAFSVAFTAARLS